MAADRHEDKETGSVDQAMVGSVHPGSSVGAIPRYRTVKYTLPEAMDAVLKGQLDWRKVLAQLRPELLGDLVGALPAAHRELFQDEKRADLIRIPVTMPVDAVNGVFSRFLEVLGEMERRNSEKITLKEAMRLVAEGKLQPMQLHAQLPPELQELFDRASRTVHDRPFTSLETEHQKGLIASFAAASQDDSESVD